MRWSATTGTAAVRLEFPRARWTGPSTPCEYRIREVFTCQTKTYYHAFVCIVACADLPFEKETPGLSDTIDVAPSQLVTSKWYLLNECMTLNVRLRSMS